MKKPKKLKKPNLPKIIGRPLRVTGKLTGKNGKSADDKVADALSNVPRITNETVSDHREEVLSSARKYIYPLQHSKHRVVKISLALFILVLVTFFTICGLSLYKFQGTSAFLHNVTRLVPFPVAKAGDDWVSYESYLFELRRNMHYYQTQQQADFTKEEKPQLQRLKQQALNQAVQDAYVKQLAKRHSVTVSDKTVNDHLALVRSQNRLGSNDRVFRDVLNEFWGWSEGDFKRALKQQLLAQAVVGKLDTQTKNKAQNVLNQLKTGADFGALASQVSEDPATKGAGGQYPAPVAKSDREISPFVTAQLFKLQPNQTSEVINTGYTLEIVKALGMKDNGVQAAHIQFNLQPVTTFTKSQQSANPPRHYIKV